jgi:8-oxo-dGTP pyrophosphatase MutT (NUDIX family)
VTDDFWKALLEALPLAAADGSESFPVSRTEIVRLVGKNTTDGAENATDEQLDARLEIVEDIFRKLSLLDVKRLSEGKWAFVSFASRLFACSLISSFAGEGAPFFEKSFWLDSGGSNRSRLFREMESRRDAHCKARPIRQNFVSWGAIMRDKKILLAPREIPKGDIDNDISGGFSLPGGRMDTGDLTGAGNYEDITSFLYGIPENKIPFSIEKSVASAYLRTLVREIEEEFGLREGEDYRTTDEFRDLKPYYGIYGASDRHVKTVTRARVFFIEPTLRGCRKLAEAEKKKGYCLWAEENYLSKETPHEKPFLAAFDNDFKVLFDAPDAEEAFAKAGGLGDVDIILPLSANENPVTITKQGRKKILPLLPDEDCVNLMLTLGFAARGFSIDWESGENRADGWGWIRLNDFYAEKARSILSRFRDSSEIAPLILDGNDCRLAQSRRRIYFSPSMYRGWLYKNSLKINRLARVVRGLCSLNDKSVEISLTPTIAEHLRRLKECEENEMLGARDNLKKAADERTGKNIHETARDFGIRELYAPTRKDEYGSPLYEFVFDVGLA